MSTSLLPLPSVLDLKVPILLDKPRTLKLDFNALAYIEQKGGRSMMSREAWESLRIKDVCVLIVAALRHEDPSIEEKTIGSMIHMGNLKAIMALLTQAWKLAFSGREDAGLPPLEIREEETA